MFFETKSDYVQNHTLKRNIYIDKWYQFHNKEGDLTSTRSHKIEVGVSYALYCTFLHNSNLGGLGLGANYEADNWLFSPKICLLLNLMMYSINKRIS